MADLAGCAATPGPDPVANSARACRSSWPVLPRRCCFRTISASSRGSTSWPSSRLSLALVIGQAGIGTLGQAAMFGAGSYGAALWAIHITPEPLSGVLIGALVGAGVAAGKRRC